MKITDGRTKIYSFDTFGFEEVFVSRVTDTSTDHFMIQQDGDFLQVPTLEYRQWLAALTKLADDEGIPS